MVKREESGHGGKRPGAGRPLGDRDARSVKIDGAILDQARVVAARRKQSLSVLLSEILAKPMERLYNAEVAAMARENSTEGEDSN